MSAVLIKKYANNKLYIPRGNTEKTGYITLNNIIDIIKKGKDIKIVDKNTGDDITNSVLITALSNLDLKYDILKSLIKNSDLND